MQDILYTGMLINFFQFLVVLLHIKLKNTHEKANNMCACTHTLHTMHAYGGLEV